MFSRFIHIVSGVQPHQYGRDCCSFILTVPRFGNSCLLVFPDHSQSSFKAQINRLSLSFLQASIVHSYLDFQSSWFVFRKKKEKHFHSPKVTVWTAISARGIIGPYFFLRFSRPFGHCTEYLTMFLALEPQEFPGYNQNSSLCRQT